MPDAWEGVDRGLFGELCQVRLEIARGRDLPPYVVFHDSTLRHLARQRPSGPRELLDPWVDPDVLERIRRVVDDPSHEFRGLKDYFEHFEGEIDYDQLKVALIFLDGSRPAVALKPTP